MDRPGHGRRDEHDRLARRPAHRRPRRPRRHRRRPAHARSASSPPSSSARPPACGQQHRGGAAGRRREPAPHPPARDLRRPASRRRAQGNRSAAAAPVQPLPLPAVRPERLRLHPRGHAGDVEIAHHGSSGGPSWATTRAMRTGATACSSSTRSTRMIEAWTEKHTKHEVHGDPGRRRRAVRRRARLDGGPDRSAPRDARLDRATRASRAAAHARCPGNPVRMSDSPTEVTPRAAAGRAQRGGLRQRSSASMPPPSRPSRKTA